MSSPFIWGVCAGFLLKMGTCKVMRIPFTSSKINYFSISRTLGLSKIHVNIWNRGFFLCKFEFILFFRIGIQDIHSKKFAEKKKSEILKVKTLLWNIIQKWDISQSIQLKLALKHMENYKESFWKLLLRNKAHDNIK